jgi:lipopolysaccharide/colanic/teichoic acid biosynthesis glycosyltransferase
MGAEPISTPFTDPGRGTGPHGEDRRASRTPAMLEMSSLAARVLEGLAVVVIGLLGIWLTYTEFDLRPLDEYVRVAWLSAIVYALVAELTGCYDIDTRFSLRQGWTRVLTAWIGSCVAMLTLAFFLKASESFSRGWTVFWFVSVAVTLTLIRGAETVALRVLKRRGVFNERVAILGSNPQGRRLASYIASNSLLTIDLVGCYDDHAVADEGGCAPLRGGVGQLLADIRAGRVDQVIVAMPFSNDEELQNVVGRLAMLPVLIRLAPDLSSFTMAGQSMVMLGDLPLMTVLIGSIILFFAAPFLALVAIAIKLDSPGPVFFKQEREGFNHRRFRIWKFRSMRTDMLQYDEVRQAQKGDPRVTRVGRIIRATSIDEVPQLINVVVGNMSLVGPRPHAPSTKVAGVLFSEATQKYAARHRVKPGMTGWAQVNGWRGETDTDEKLLKRVEFDLFYIDHWSVGFDLYIMARTVAAVLFPRSAY